MNKNDYLKHLQLLFKFSAPLASVVLMVFGNAFFTTFSSVYLDSMGYSRGEIGIVQSAFFFGMFAGAFRMEDFIRRVGHVQALTVFGSVATCSSLLLAVYQTFLSWILLRFLIGVSLAALYIVIESWMLQHSNIKTRGTVLSLYMIALYTSQSVSQQILSFIDIHTLMPYIISAFFTSISIIPVGLSTKRIALSSSQERIGLIHIFKMSPFGVSGCFASGLFLSALYSFLPLFSVSRDIASANLMSVTIAGGVLLQWPLGKLSDYFERRRTLLCVVVTSLILSVIGFIYQGNAAIFLLSLAFFIGGFAFTLYPLSITQVCDRLAEAHITTATALLLIAYGFGSIIGPVISASMIGYFGINTLFLYFALLLFALALVGLYSTIRRPIVPLDEQTGFVPSPNVTPVACEMDPRGEG